MKVLYFIPKTKGGILPFFSQELIDSIAAIAEVHVMTPRAEESPHTGGAKIHRLSAYRLMIGRNRKRFDKVAGEVNPDIIHIIGSWDVTACFIARWAGMRRIPVVVSPLKGLAPWNTLRSYWLRRLPQLLLYQKGVISGAHAVHALSRQEQSLVTAACRYPLMYPRKPWNTRIAVIEDPRLDGDTTTAAAASAMVALYNKVSDSNPFMRMTQEDRAYESALLRAGLARDAISAGIPPDMRRQMMQMSDASWRRIMLHAADERIGGAVTRGALTMQLKRKSIVIENTGRFEQARRTDTRSLAAIPPLVKRRKIERLAGRCGDEAAARICTMTVNVVQMMRSGTLCRSHLADLYTVLRFGGCDENALRLMLRRLGAARTAARLMQIMGETMGLEQGFMPLEPLDDRGTQHIRDILFNLKIQ